MLDIVTYEQLTQKVVEDKLVAMEGPSSASEALTAELAESDKLIVIDHVEVGSLEKLEAGLNTRKAEAENVVTKAGQGSDHLIVRVNVAILRENWAKSCRAPK